MTSIQVAVRVRPFNSRETKYCSSLVINMKGQNVTEMIEMRNGKANSNMPPRAFNFDHCFWTHSQEGAVIPDVDPDLNCVLDESCLATTDPIFASQAFVYAQIGHPMLDNALKGFNACLFAYGQTGSGKTYSMMGIPSDPGVIPRLCKELFLRASHLRQDYGTHVGVTCTYLEIYNENVRDLLNPSEMDKNLKVRQHPKLGVFVEGLTKLDVSSEEEIAKLLEDGGKVRHVAATNMNASSSRSHAILTFALLVKDKDDSELGSSLNLVDLAGSERAASTGAEGATLAEGANINKSLTTLGMCLSRLAEAADGKNKNHIPYRDSQLTWILNDSLGGNSKTAMLANISPASINFEETLSTLRFAMTVKKIKNNAVINEDPQQRLIRELRAEIEEIKIKIGELESGIEATPAEANTEEEEEEVEVTETVVDEEGNETTVVVMKKQKKKKGMSVEEQGMEQLEALEHATRLMEEAAESSDDKKRRVAAAKADHEKAMLAFSKASGVYVDNSLCKLVTLNEDLHAFPSVALLYYLRQGANRIGCGTDRKKVLVKIPRDHGRETVSLYHAAIDCDTLQKKVYIRLCTEDEQPDASSSAVVENVVDDSIINSRTSRKAPSPIASPTASTSDAVSLGATFTAPSPAPVFVNGIELLAGESRQLFHKDRIMVGPLAFRHSQPAPWFTEDMDEEFSRNVKSIDHCDLLEHHIRLGVQIEEERCITDLWQEFKVSGGLLSQWNEAGGGSSSAGGGTYAGTFQSLPDEAEYLEGHEESVAMLMFQAGECENTLVQRFPLTEAMKAEQLAVAAAKDSGVDLDYAFAVKERDETLKRLLQQRQVIKRDEELSRLREQEKQGEVEIEKLKEQLAEQQRVRAEAEARRKEKHSILEKEKETQQQRKREATDKASSLQQLAIELQRYEEEVRNATTWKPMGPTSPEDIQEYDFSQKPPTYSDVFEEGGGTSSLIMVMSVQKMRLERGVFSALRSGWHKVFLVVRPRFMYYFTKNEPKAPAAGAAYLYGCDLQVPTAPLEKQNFPLRVVPCVPRSRTKSSKGETDDNNVLLAFESEDDRQKFKSYVESIFRPACPDRVAAYLQEQEEKAGAEEE